MSTQPKAEQIAFTPCVGITSTNLQAAVTELDSEAVKVASLAGPNGSGDGWLRWRPFTV